MHGSVDEGGDGMVELPMQTQFSLFNICMQCAISFLREGNYQNIYWSDVCKNS